MTSVKSNLVQGLTKDEKDEFLRQLKYSPLIEKLREIARTEISKLETPSREVYKDAAWAYRQADENGERRAYQTLLKLLDHEEKI
jgi:hypothetical protein